jgi:pimeloyl-ACP methyl ester carboxylesterase
MQMDVGLMIMEIVLMHRKSSFAVLAALFLSAFGPANAAPIAKNPVDAYRAIDSRLVKELPGFTSRFADVNGIRLHYVEGGSGTTVVLIPGWPETWWAYHKIMPELAKTHRVLSVDVRGMGESAKPEGGYDKKTMAADVSALIEQLGFEHVDVIGHDIGAMVAYSLAANHADQVQRLVLLDVAHPSAGYLKLPLLPEKDTFGDKLDEAHPYFWWFAFHQVKGMPEELLEGRAGIEQAWFFHYMMKDENAINARDRRVYAAAYASRDALRASNGWYQAFGQDILDEATYAKLTMPILGIGGPGFVRLKVTLEAKANESKTFKIEKSGHFIAEEAPTELLGLLHDFLQR